MNKYKIKLSLKGVGYKWLKEENYLSMYLGYSHSLKIKQPKEISYTITNAQEIEMFSSSKQSLGEFAAFLRALKKPEPYKGKGIFLHFKKNIKNLERKQKKGKK